jgi:NAD(P)H-hydrate epimerase
MIKVVNEQQIRAIEAEADEKGLSYDELMQKAGRAVADRVIAAFGSRSRPQVTILVGPGNNGGDGLVTGLFIGKDRPDAVVRFYLLKQRPDDLYFQAAQQGGLLIAFESNDGDKRLLRNMIASSDVVVDALFGIGVHLPLRDEAQKVLRATRQALNERRNAQPEEYTLDLSDLKGTQKAPPIVVIAVDLPSGVDANTGKTDKLTLVADETVTFIAAKHGHFLGDATEVVGNLVIANLSVQEKNKALAAINDTVIDADSIRDLLPQRSLNSNKGTYGKALVVAGSSQYLGAPLLSAQAAYRVGAGLVTVAAPQTVVNAIAPQIPEVTWLPMNPDSQTETVLSRSGTSNALLIGPGLSTDANVQIRLLSIFSHQSSLPPLVIDADALNILAQQEEWWSLLPPNSILTPHPGEMSRLTGIETAALQADRFNIARDCAKRWNQIVVLKGAHTLIANPEGEVAVSPFKTDALAKAGTGDVLAGMIVGFLAQGVKPFDAAKIAVYVHGAAGIAAAHEHGNRAVLAHEVSNHVGKVLQALR